MDRSILAAVIALLSITAHGQPYYIYTNELGRLQATPSQADTVYAIGAVVTSSVLPVVNSDVWDLSPDVTIPIIDPATSNVVGTARLIANPDMSLVAVTNSASPQRPKSEQLAAYRAAVLRDDKARSDLSAIKTNAAAANSIPALREQVRRLAELLESRP